MDFIKNFTFTPINVLKALGVLFVSLFVIVFSYNLFNSSFPSTLTTGSYPSVSSIAPGYGGMAEMPVYDSYADEMYEKSAPTLSTRNMIYPPVGGGGGGVGDGAEDFEVTDYNANIETRNKSRDCQEILKLKSLAYVVFENNTESETSCNYTFKVLHKNVPEVVEVIKSLNPRDFSENTYTIKKQVEDFTSEIEILKKKIDSIDRTMTSALRAYDEITQLATKTQDAFSLAKIIEGKIQIIQRLTDEGINASSQLERLTRAKAEQVDRVEYTYFHINIYENKYIDWKNIKDSWKNSIRDFFYTVNRIIQDSTINVVVFLLTLIPYLIYLGILLVAGKYFWKFAKHIWQDGNKSNG
ncbi:MAG: hypothetical protein WAX44_00555 [Minisyncoccia bacterium]